MTPGAAGTASYHYRGETVAQDETDAAARLAEALIKAESDRTLVWGNVEIVSLLLPVVRELGDLRAAEELRTLACDAMERTPGAAPVTVTVAEIFDRAATLRGEAGR